MNNSIKTAQSQAGLDFAHTADSRPTALNRAKKFILTLLALLTISTGAWADGVTASEIDATVSAGWGSDESLIKASDLPGYNKITLEQAVTWASAPASGTVYLIYEIVADGEFKIAEFEDGNYTDSFGWSEETHNLIWEDINYGGKRYFYTTGPAASGPEVTLNEASTEATMEMPASDVTVTYELVRDLTQQVTFGGIPTGDGLVVKKGGTAYEFVTAPDFTLTDPLAAADAQNIIQADDITITVGKMVEVEGFEGYRQFDEATAVSLADFLANPQPGTYKMKATATADGPYDGTVYSAEFTTVEKYDLLIQPADEYSKGKLTEVTVAGAAQTLDADGKVTTTAEPGKEVKLKAKTGYVIEKVEAKKPVTSAIVNPQVGQIIGSDGKNYAADATLPSGVTAVAMIAYVGSETDDTDYTGGLAIALSDEGRMNWSTAKSTCEGKTAVTGAKWCLPSQNQWKAMFKANGGSESSYTGLNTAISTAGGTALQKSCYWSSTEHGEVNAYYVYLFSGNAYFSNASKGIDYLVRAVLAF